MKRENLIIIIGVFGIVFYLVLVMSALDYLGRLNQEIKEKVFQHYNVPLPKEK